MLHYTAIPFIIRIKPKCIVIIKTQIIFIISVNFIESEISINSALDVCPFARLSIYIYIPTIWSVLITEELLRHKTELFSSRTILWFSCISPVNSVFFCPLYVKKFAPFMKKYDKLSLNLTAKNENNLNIGKSRQMGKFYI